MDTFLEYARTGKAEELRVLLLNKTLSNDDYVAIVVEAAIHGHVIVLQKCIGPSLFQLDMSDITTQVCLNATKSNHLHILEYLELTGLDIWGRLYNNIIWIGAIEHGHLEMLKWWTEKRKSNPSNFKQPIRQALSCAIWSKQSHILQWLLENGHREFIYISLNASSPEILRLLHVYNVDGNYTKQCAKGTCVACKEEAMWNTWIMETAE